MRAIYLWILWCAYFNCVGWFLAAIHQLNAPAYAVAMAAGIIGVIIAWKKTPVRVLHGKRFGRRFRRLFPAIFLVVTVLVATGGLLYAPNNYDAMTYRLPRMLNWWTAGHWFWIPTINERMNYSTTAWEWSAMPLFTLLHSDRILFLIDVSGFLLMPGLLFSIFRGVGIRRRTAWTWMWILPLAYGYVTQAGSIGNDITGTVFVLGSVFFGLRARRTGRVDDIWMCGIAAALMTATKLSTLPLLLPCLVAVGPALPALRRRWLASVPVVIVAGLISALPTMALNQMHTGSWNGDPNNADQIQVKKPAAALLGNGLLLVQQSFMPPVLPGARKATELFTDKLPTGVRQQLKDNFPRYYLNKLNELPQEEAADLDLGITSLVLLGTIAAAFSGKRKISRPSDVLIGFAAWIAVMVYLLKMGSEATSRLMLPYYPLALLPLLHWGCHENLLRFRSWRMLVACAAVSALPAIVLSPARPLFPAATVVGWLAKHRPESGLTQRLNSVYSTYAHRNDLLR